MTIEQIANSFIATALAHKSINASNTGETFEFAVDGDELYPVVWLSQPFVINSDTRGRETINTQFLILDKPETGEGDETDLLSKTKEIADAIIYYINNVEKPGYSIAENYVMTSVTEYSDNLDCGWIVDITINNTKEINTCGIEGQFNVPN